MSGDDVMKEAFSKWIRATSDGSSQRDIFYAGYRAALAQASTRGQVVEECCKALCILCRNGVPMSETRPTTYHQQPDYQAWCSAAPLRALAAPAPAAKDDGK